MLIKNTKLAEERQSVALVGKRTIEDIENVIAQNNDKNKKITKPGDRLVISDLNFLKKEETIPDLELAKSSSEESFSKRLSLDSNYNFCDVSGKACVYEEEIKIEKAKGRIGENISVDEINMDINEAEKAKIDENIKTIRNDFSITKGKGESDSKIGNKSEEDKEKKTISSEDGALVLHVVIEQVDDNVEISIQDKSGKDYVEPIKKPLDISKVNNIDLHFNFKEYFKDTNEQLKKLNIDVRNRMKDNTKVVSNVNLYIEKPVDLEDFVESKASKGDINIHKRDENSEIVKVGPLYNIQVEIEKKGETSKLFSGNTNKNINIKENP